MADSNLYKRGNSWYISIKVDGKRVRRSCGSDKNAAIVALAEMEKRRALIRMGDLEIPEFESSVRKKKRRPFSDVAEDFLAEKSATNRKTTMIDYRRMLDSYILPFIGNDRIDLISEQQLVRMRNKWSTHLGPRAVNKNLIFLNAIFKMAHRRKEIKENPMVHVSKLKAPKRRNKVLSLEQLQVVLSLVPQKWKPIITFMAYTGCRHAEVFGLRWGDVDLERGELNITHGRARGIEAPPKTDSSIRTIPILPPVREVLESVHSSGAPTRPNDHVFLSPLGRLLNDSSRLNKVWKQALRRAGIPETRSYELRHTFASNMLERGVPALYVSSLLGHSDLSTTFRAYATVIGATKDKNRTLMESILGSVKSGYTMSDGELKT